MELEENDMLKFLSFGSSFLIVCFTCEWLLPFLKKKTKMKIKIYRLKFLYIIICCCCCGFHVYSVLFQRGWYRSQQLYIAKAVCLAFLLIFSKQLSRIGKHTIFKLFYNKAEINLCLKDNENIGALWAHQTYEAYYKITLENILDRMVSFEEKYNIHFSTKKQLIVIPLSCSIDGEFTEKDPLIEIFEDLEIVEDDAGGNINRQFKNPVFKICSSQDNVYVVAEFSQPVSTLSRSRQFELGNEKFVFIRDCYIKTLKLLLQGSPSNILVIHDDEKESLSSCLLSAIENDRIGAEFLV